MGANHSIHVADNAGEDIYVMAVLNSEWAVLDFLSNALLFVDGVGEVKEVAEVAEIPKEIKSVEDLVDILKVAIKHKTTGQKPTAKKEIKKIFEAFEKNSIQKLSRIATVMESSIT